MAVVVGVEAIEIENAETKYPWEWGMDAKLFQPMHFFLSNISQSQKNFKLLVALRITGLYIPLFCVVLFGFVSSPSHPKDKKKTKNWNNQIYKKDGGLVTRVDDALEVPMQNHELLDAGKKKKKEMYRRRTLIFW